MARRLKKKVKYSLIIIIFILLGYIFFSTYNYLSSKKEIPKEEPSNEEVIPKKEEEIIEELPYESILNDNGIFSTFYEEAYNLLETMSLDEKISQIFLVRVPKENEISIIEEYQFGGYLLFGKDVNNITKEDLINKINSFQTVSKIPSIIAIDEEGGTISRIRTNPNLVEEPFSSPMDLYKEGGLPLIEEDLIRKNNLLTELGINLNIAPVVDISSPDSFIYKRTLGEDANTTSIYASKVIEVSKQSKVSYVLKHFPGYGDNIDTHTGIAIDNRTLDELKEKDFLPFISGINSGAECILVNHNIMTNIEDNMPASLSKEVHNILRNDLSYTGIIITDDLYMDAIKKYQENPSIKALLAGNDMIIITDYITGINEIKEAINNNTIDINILNKAVLRILAWKYYKGLL